MSNKKISVTFSASSPKKLTPKQKEAMRTGKEIVIAPGFYEIDEKIVVNQKR